MGNSDDKFNNSRRRAKDSRTATRQVEIIKFRRLEHNKSFEQPGRLVKRHAMDCGNPGCMLCGNPRHTHGSLTHQENKLFQDMDNVRGNRNNGDSESE